MLAIESPYPQFFALDGKPLDAGYIFIGVENQDPETNPIVVYWDVALTIPAPQPLRTLNGMFANSGTPAFVYTATDYSIMVRDSRMQQVVYAPSSSLFSVAGRIDELRAELATPVGSSMIGRPSGGTLADLFAQSDTLADRLLPVKLREDGGVWRTQEDANADFLHAAQFGVVANTGADQGPAMLKSIAAAQLRGKTLWLPAGDIVIDGHELVITKPMVMRGQGRENTRLIFKGTPTKTVRTRAVWQVAYDVGDYSVPSIDAPIACGIVVRSDQVFISDMNLRADWDEALNHPLPFNSLTDYPTSGYDNAILLQQADCTLERLLINGPWGSIGFNGGIKVDVTFASPEHCKILDCEVYGRWGLVVEGPHGAGTAPNYLQMTLADTRGGGGVSDLLCIGSQFYDTSGNNGVRLTIGGDSGKRVRRWANTGGALWIDGQASRNTAKRQQQITFIRCRFANCDWFTMYLNFINRLEFAFCHSEFRAGFLDLDGVTPLAVSDSNGRFSTINAQAIAFVGGEKSGEPDNLTYKDTVNQINLISEFGLSEPTTPGFVQTGRMLSGVEFRERGKFVPIFTAATPGAPTYATQDGSYTKIGNLVFITLRVSLTSKGGIAGTITIGGLPFTASSAFGSPADVSLAVGLTSTLTFGTEAPGAFIDDGTKRISLVKLRNGASVQTISDADLADTTQILLSGMYMTEDA